MDEKTTENTSVPLTEREKKLMKEIEELREANNILKDAFSFFCQRPKEITIRNIHEFILENKDKYHVNKMRKILSVNEKGYYKKLKVGERILKWQKLLNEIHKILDEDINNNNYGANRMLIALRQKA